MNVAHVRDVDFCTRWYTYSKENCPKLEAANSLIKSPFAFAIVANFIGLCAVSPEPKAFLKAGWKPVVWKESSHAEKYSVQLWMKETDIAPVNTGTDCVPGLSCSVFWRAFDTPKVFDSSSFPTAPHKFGLAASKDNLKFVRLARPIAKAALAYFKADPMWKLCAKTKWHQYWAWGYPGLADNAKCAY